MSTAAAHEVCINNFFPPRGLLRHLRSAPQLYRAVGCLRFPKDPVSITEEPTFWTTLCIGRHTTEEFLAVVLDRSGALPLYLSIDATAHRKLVEAWDRPPRSVQPQPLLIFTEMLRFRFAPHFWRVSTVHLEAQLYGDWHAVFSAITALPAPRVRNLSVSADWVSRNPLPIFTAAAWSNLAELQACRLLPVIGDPKSYQALSCVTLQSIKNFDADTLLCFLASLPLLQHLELRRVRCPSSFTVREVSLLSLRKLLVSYSQDEPQPVWGGIHAPKLRELVIELAGNATASSVAAHCSHLLPPVHNFTLECPPHHPPPPDALWAAFRDVRSINVNGGGESVSISLWEWFRRNPQAWRSLETITFAHHVDCESATNFLGSRSTQTASAGVRLLCMDKGGEEGKWVEYSIVGEEVVLKSLAGRTLGGMDIGLKV
ncbi:hypothetical protein R3P38DRAFT_2809834 [Favolaschia claudopus]|uniref:F-box domain-containing protein n=1 Tax=Favolaschia claudopus TaxID=2862362 RepID=A0AAV9ZCM9_9AGAR